MKKIYLLLLCACLGLKPAAAQFFNALNFDGANDHVSSSVPGLFNNLATQDLTIEAWIQPANLVFSRILFAQGSNSTNFATLTLSTDGVIYLYLGRGATGLISAKTTTNPVVLNQWTHVAATWSAATTTISIYINGVLASMMPGGTSSTGVSNAMAVGSRSDGASQFFNGAIDELRIWNTARTSAQINESKNHELTLPQFNLLVYYKFNQGVANGNNPTITTSDDALNTTNGVLNNFTLNGNTSNWVANSLVLPLQWLEVNGTLTTAHETALSWKVREKQVAVYVVERSIDGKNFTALSSVNSKGDGMQEYRFVDIDPAAGINYYRLKQVDEDGIFTYSKIVTVTLANNRADAMVYPNPVTTLLNITPGKQKGNFQVYDGIGRLLFSGAPAGTTPFQLDVSRWQPGVYFFRIGDQQGSFMKQ